MMMTDKKHTKGPGLSAVIGRSVYTECVQFDCTESISHTDQ
ncbi:hypothetical protein A2U01_0118562, partial [Trifolium medium]|nr:hypothetical protein [Trifolium medium]